MGFRFRKSFSAGPLRINLSKSGVGWSVGGKGARFTKKATGGTRSTLSLPGTGISYVKETGKKKNSNKASSKISSSSTSKNTTSPKGKKPFYKKWWVWAIIIVCLLSSCSVGEEESPIQTSEEYITSTPEPTMSIAESFTPVAAPLPTAEPTPTLTPEPTPAFIVENISGNKYTTTSVNVRSGPGTDYEVIDSYDRNTYITLTGKTNNGWYRIDYNGENAYLHSDYTSNSRTILLSEITVYVSNSGKYHTRSGCHGMKYYTEMSMEDAINTGYDPCSTCN